MPNQLLTMQPPNHLATFVGEVEDLLGIIEAATLALETDPRSSELIDQLFRAFHTLKGSSGAVGIVTISKFTHHVESAMDKVRSGSLAMSPALASLVLHSKDHVADLLAEALGGTCDHSRGDALLAQLGQLVGDAAAIAAAPAPAPSRGMSTEYLVAFDLRPDVTEEIEIAGVEADLAALGECTVTAPLPAWRALVSTPLGENAIRDAFLFIQGHGELAIDAGLNFFTDDPEPVAPPPAPVAPVPAPAAPTTSRKPVAADSMVRVPAERLDQLVKLIGELVITQSRLEQVHQSSSVPELAGPVEAMDRLISDLRDGVLGLRMVPIGMLFTRFHRLVRDLSGELGKAVELVTAGDETELDKSVIDQLGDVLVHILRNSLDHGLEDPATREDKGKPRTGTLRLEASHEGTHVMITVSDDGRGIDTAAVRRKAEEKGLIGPGEVVSEQDMIAMIMRPGFSTAAAVTELSGRGVGMDVVKKTIEGLRGTISITSEVGRGTAIRMKLPLTLAIIDGLMVEIHGDRFIVPMGAVTENLELSAAERKSNNGRNLVTLRGEMVPYIRMRELFEVEESDEPIEKVVVVTVDGQRVGLVVDRVIGNHQTVIQPLGVFYKDNTLFSGATILGDGRVAMILDLSGTVRSLDAAVMARN